LAPKSFHDIGERGGSLVDSSLSGESHEERASLLENVGGDVRILEHELCSLELAAVAERFLKSRVRRIRMRHFADQDLDHAGAYAGSHADPYGVPVPAIGGGVELVEKILPERALLPPLTRREKDADRIDQRRLGIKSA